MNWLIFYLLGVVVVLTMMSKPLYKELKEGNNKPKVEIIPLLRLLSFVILSWVFVAYVAIDESWND